MQIKKILDEKDIKKIEEIIERNYGCRFGMQSYNAFITSEEKIWLVSKSIDFGLFKKIKRCYRIGIYFGKLKRNNKIKLSIEGANLIGKNASKNIAILNDKEAIKFIEGYDVKADELINCELNNFVLIKHKDDVLGVGILRQGHIENLTPKARRLKI